MSFRRSAAGDLRKLGGGIASGGLELLKIAREMLVIPAQLWLALAEIVGAAVLAVWRGVALPAILAALAAVRALYRFSLRHVRPVHGVAAVTVVAIAALAASQWVDYRGVSVGTDAYSPSLEAVAPAPEVARERAGEAHSWVMVPLSAVALAILALALRGRRRLARLLAPIGLAAIVIVLAVDASKGLEEGTAAVTYQGAEARLLEGFWLQIAAGAVLIACGLLLPRYIGAQPSGASRTSPRSPRRFAELRRRLGGGALPGRRRRHGGVEKAST